MITFIICSLGSINTYSMEIWLKCLLNTFRIIILLILYSICLKSHVKRYNGINFNNKTKCL